MGRKRPFILFGRYLTLLVKMLTLTNYNGVKAVGETYEVSSAIGDRWVSRGLAEAVEAETEVESESESEYGKMSGKELFKLCGERKIIVEPRQPKGYYIKKLEEADAE